MSSSELHPVKLSQWDALTLESLKGLGWPAEELIHKVRTGELPADESKFKFDYTRLTELEASDPAAFEQALRSGYQIKYNTLRGISSWLLLTLGHEAEVNVEPGQEAVTATLTEEEHNRLKSVLSYGWTLKGYASAAAGGKSSYVIEPLARYEEHQQQ
jgi:hypothetical protein